MGNTSSLLAGEMTGSSHRLRIRIYYAHTDFSGVVYHARYLEFFERGRIEYFRSFNERYKDFLTEVDRTLVWVVRHLEMRFRRPARAGRANLPRSQCGWKISRSRPSPEEHPPGNHSEAQLRASGCSRAAPPS